MYIKLGSTRLNYIKQSPNDFNIVSQVVDSSMSYERPVLVRTTTELDIWFGKDYPDYDYLQELIRSGVTLYLYKPVSSQESYFGIDKVFDLENYYSDTIYPTIDYISQTIENLEEQEEKVFKVYGLDGSIDKYIYYLGEFINIEDLQQNQIVNNTSSLSNRDTLVIGDSFYISPSYKQDMSGQELGNFESLGVDIKNKSDINFEKIRKGQQALAFNYSFSGFSDRYDDFQFIRFKVFNEGKIIDRLCILGSMEIKDITQTEKYSRISFGVDEVSLIDPTKGGVDLLSEIFKGCSTRGNTIISPILVDVDYFYDIDGFSLVPNQEITENILYYHFCSSKEISFVSKTIGTSENLIDGNIKINISDIGNGNYQVRVKRFDYEEIHEGNCTNLGNIISMNSSLVYCTIYKDKISTGEWELHGGKVEEPKETSYWKALDSLVNPPETIYFDYLLIPDIKRFISPEETDYDLVYKNLIQFSKDIDFQILVQCNDNWKIVECLKKDLPRKPENGTLYKLFDDNNTQVDSKVYVDNRFVNLNEIDDCRLRIDNDFRRNYTGDKDNRIVYFYLPMEVYGISRPGYYLYLSDLYNRDVYSASTKEILYKSPINKTTDFYDDVSVLERELEEKKCNYLSENNQIYYYKNYQNGDSPTTTCWMRFCIGKIKRELTKNKWSILDSRDVNKIRERITSILNRITSAFSMIRRIEISSFGVSFKDKYIELTIDTYISDLVDNSISIDLTLNYNA